MPNKITPLDFTQEMTL